MQQRQKASTPIVSILFYILAALVFLIGLLVAMNLFNAPSAIRGATIILQNPVFQPILNQINQAFVLAGTVLLAISVVFSGALVGLGRLVTQNRRLALRVQELEALQNTRSKNQ